jgi:carotenoid cleavage dioxygenase-like enzyme
MPVNPFDRDLVARFGVVPRHGAGAEVRWFEAEPCYVHHSVNDFTAPPVARVVLPARVPIGFHACWMPGAAVSDS